jgi:MFS transporter, PHS family, inorganic phosphate transporter
MSATVVSDRANIHRRGTMLCFIFANQGWGSFIGSLVTLITLAAFKSDIRSGHPKHIDRIWRILIGFSLIPAFAVLYQRLTLPESRKFTLVKESHDDLVAADNHKDIDHKEKDLESNDSPRVEPADAHEGGERHGVIASKRASWQDFLHYLKEWSHLKVLLGTMLAWFFVDIAFYGINVRLFSNHINFSFVNPLLQLNQSVVLTQIGYGGAGKDIWGQLWALAVGNVRSQSFNP